MIYLAHKLQNAANKNAIGKETVFFFKQIDKLLLFKLKYVRVLVANVKIVYFHLIFNIFGRRFFRILRITSDKVLNRNGFRTTHRYRHIYTHTQTHRYTQTNVKIY